MREASLNLLEEGFKDDKSVCFEEEDKLSETSLSLISSGLSGTSSSVLESLNEDEWEGGSVGT